MRSTRPYDWEREWDFDETPLPPREEAVPNQHVWVNRDEWLGVSHTSEVGCRFLGIIIASKYPPKSCQPLLTQLRDVIAQERYDDEEAEG